MYAIIMTGGKQYKVQPGDVINVERLAVEEGSKFTFDNVIAAGEGADIKTGTPYLEDASVEAEIIQEFRDDKVVAFKMKRRKGYRRTRGHRQTLTKVKISSITLDGQTVGETAEA